MRDEPKTAGVYETNSLFMGKQTSKTTHGVLAVLAVGATDRFASSL